MAFFGGSAHAVVRALRRRTCSQLDPGQEADADASLSTGYRTSQATNEDQSLSFARNGHDSEYLLEAHSCGRGFGTESSDNSSLSSATPSATPTRTMTCSSMQGPQEFTKFVERRLAREIQFREEAYVDESLLRRFVSEPNSSDEESDLLCQFRCANLEVSSETASDATLPVSRSVRVDNFPDASEYLSPAKLRLMLKAMR